MPTLISSSGASRIWNAGSGGASPERARLPRVPHDDGTIRAETGHEVPVARDGEPFDAARRVAHFAQRLAGAQTRERDARRIGPVGRDDALAVGHQQCAARGQQAVAVKRRAQLAVGGDVPEADTLVVTRRHERAAVTAELDAEHVAAGTQHRRFSLRVLQRLDDRRASLERRLEAEGLEGEEDAPVRAPREVGHGLAGEQA